MNVVMAIKARRSRTFHSLMGGIDWLLNCHYQCLIVQKIVLSDCGVSLKVDTLIATGDVGEERRM